MKFLRCSPGWMLVGVVYVAYLGGFWGDFQFDDYNVIVDNPAVHSWSAWLADAVGIRPLLKLTYTLNCTSGLGIFGFHLFNVSVHAANSLLVYFLFCSLAEHHSFSTSAGKWRVGPLIGALLFAVHPVQTEAVTYISGRSMSLMTLFYLGSLLSYVHGRKSDRPLWIYLLSPVLFVLAMLTKEVAVTLPLTLVLLEWMNVNGMATLKQLLSNQAVHWIILGLALLVVAFHPIYSTFLEFDPTTGNLLTQAYGITYLLSRFIWVHRLNIDPEMPHLTGWNMFQGVEAALLGALLVFGTVSLLRRQWIGLAIVWLFLHLLPTNSLIQRLDVANERQLYLAGCGIFLAAGMAIEKWQTAWPRYALQVGGAVVVLMLTLSLFTAMRNRDYRSEIALWEATVRLSPRKPRVHNNLGYVYFQAGQYGKAKQSYLAALQLNPAYERARNNLAMIEESKHGGASYRIAEVPEHE